MKASPPPPPPHHLRPQDSSGCDDFSLRYLSGHSLGIGRCKTDEEDLFCLQYDMDHCYSRLKRLVPTIPQNKKVSKVEILQHVIDYILDLQLALETHPALMKHAPSPVRAPLAALNTEQRTTVVNKQEDSILCR